MYKNIVILTGAGISQESGISTFRDNNGLWNNYSIQDVATLEGFKRNPDLVYEFYNMRRRELLSETIEPNSAHIALAELEESWKGEFLLVTQNVDNLHEQAGSRNVVHMHGELMSALCIKSGKRYPWYEDLDATSQNPETGEIGNLRPDIVWFGEEPYQLERIYDALKYCRLFIAIGTSGTVYPAAGFVQEVFQNCARTIEVNLEKTDISSMFDENYFGKASEIVTDLAHALIN